MEGVLFIEEQTKFKEDNYGGQKKVIKRFDPHRSEDKICIMKNQDQKNIGSKEREFFDIQPWLDSDCEDDFINVKAGSKEEVIFNWLDSDCGDDFISVKTDAVPDKDNYVSVYEDKKANPSQESWKLLANDQESGTVMLTIDFDEKMELALKRNNRAKLWEFILLCIVNNGLFESISSLIIVTCAATANIPNGNILALAMTNLITGLFIIRHNLERVLRQHKQKMGASGIKKMGASGIKVEQENQLKKVGKNILEYLLPFTMTVLSFLFFGMVPPLVYVFTFRGTDDKNFKLATMVGASLLCTTLLAFLKAHLQKPRKWVFYGKTVVCFVSIGVLAFVLSYLAGDLLGKLIQKFDYWFE